MHLLPVGGVVVLVAVVLVGTTGGGTGTGTGGLLLNGDAATEGAGLSIVAATDDADIASGATSALKVVGQGSLHLELLGLGLGQAVGAGDVVGHGHLDEIAVAGLVNIADIGAGAVGVDLVDIHGDGGAARHLGQGARLDGLLGLGLDVDAAGLLSPAAVANNLGRDLSLADEGGVLLAGAGGGAVAGKVGDDLESNALGRTSNASETQEGGVGVDTGQGGENDGSVAEEHLEGAGGKKWEGTTTLFWERR